MTVELRPNGQYVARLAGDYTELAHLGGAIGDTADEAVEGLAATVVAVEGQALNLVTSGYSPKAAENAQLADIPALL